MATDIRAAGLAVGHSPNMFYSGHAVSTQYGTLLPPKANVACYVRSTGIQDQDPPEIANRLVPTLAQALRYARPNKGDFIVVMPGHTENVTDNTMFANLVAGTHILGIGHGTQAPTFNWTTTAGQWTINKENVVIQGLRLLPCLANGVTKAIDVTEAYCTFLHNDIVIAAGAALKAAIVLDVSGVDAAGFVFAGNKVTGTTGHNVTDGVLISAAISDFWIVDNHFFASATSANGLIRVSAAALLGNIGHNIIYNTMTAAALVGINLGTAATTGMCWDNRIGILTGGAMASGTHGISFGGAVDWRFYNNLISDSANADGIGLITDAA